VGRRPPRSRWRCRPGAAGAAARRQPPANRGVSA
jgi:hypothetical protein